MGETNDQKSTTVSATKKKKTWETEKNINSLWSTYILMFLTLRELFPGSFEILPDYQQKLHHPQSYSTCKFFVIRRAFSIINVNSVRSSSLFGFHTMYHDVVSIYCIQIPYVLYVSFPHLLLSICPKFSNSLCDLLYRKSFYYIISQSCDSPLSSSSICFL